jgi:hypothetical protein
VNHTEYFVALAVSAAISEITEPTGTSAIIQIAFTAMLFVCWVNAMREEQKP